VTAHNGSSAHELIGPIAHGRDLACWPDHPECPDPEAHGRINGVPVAPESLLPPAIKCEGCGEGVYLVDVTVFTDDQRRQALRHRERHPRGGQRRRGVMRAVEATPLRLLVLGAPANANIEHFLIDHRCGTPQCRLCGAMDNFRGDPALGPERCPIEGDLCGVCQVLLDRIERDPELLGGAS
jgi:hypothetical protein